MREYERVCGTIYLNRERERERERVVDKEVERQCDQMGWLIFRIFGHLL